MKRTKPGILVVLAAIGIAGGFLTQVILVSIGRPMLIPPATLAVTLVAIAGIILGFAIPIRRSVKGHSSGPVNPFQAFRVAILAKSSALSGALLTGATAGFLIFIVSRTVLPQAGSIWLAVVAFGGAAILLAGGLVAEWLCTLPPGDEPDQPMGKGVPHES
ncbi:DUF3180 domain-containing protein [Homoserinimonas sp. OAct 916]|uniref:DUF3180 domain-containing protein n=1 Tax=Homoserinimonas sp. OAct 916 TaxID=2211450 RepID=UPI000DBE0306|nr:DUF3180 domain-containing protein [Homoserinimonas sp. OAct 916]